MISLSVKDICNFTVKDIGNLIHNKFLVLMTNCAQTSRHVKYIHLITYVPH